MATRETGHEDSLWLNDVLLHVAPTQINITNQSFNYEWETLRTKNPQRTKSGHSVLNVTLNVTWVGEAAINETIRPLLAQLRLTPFCWAENEFLRNNLFPNEGEATEALRDGIGQEPIVLVFRSALLEVDPSTAPITVQGVLEFSYFNYKPYCPYYQFKQTRDQILLPAGVSGTTPYPSESEPWRLFYQGALDKTEKIVGQFKGDASLHFLEFRTSSTASAPELEAQLNILQSLGGNRPELFLEAFSKNIGPDIAVSALQAARDAGIAGPNDSIGQAEALIPILRESSPRFFEQRHNREHALTEGGRNAPYEDLVDRERLANAIEAIRARLNNINSLQEDTARLEGVDQFEKVAELSTNRGADIATWKRVRKVDLKAQEGIVIVNIRVSFRNRLAVLPVIGHRYATFQHLGSVDAIVDIDTMVTTDTANRRLAWFYHTVEDNALKNKRIPQGLQTVRVQNDFLKLFGLRHFITQDYSSDTVPGEPGTYAVSLRMVESGVGPDDSLDTEALKPEFVSSDPAIKAAILKTLFSHIKLVKVGPFQGLELSMSGLDPVRQQAFIQVIKDILPGYNLFLRNMRDHVGDTGKTSAFFRAGEESIPGITLIQDVIAAELGPKDLERILALSTIDSATRDDLRRRSLGDARRLRSQLSIDEASQTDVNRMSPEQLARMEARNRNLLEFGGDVVKDKALLIQHLGVDQDRLDTVQGLKRSQAVQRWFRDINQLTDGIIQTQKIAIPEFAEAYSLAQQQGVNKGRSAYPDLGLKSVADVLGLPNELPLDPDFYLYTPIKDSATQVLDPLLITQAKSVALEGYHSAKGNIDSYFKKWLGLFSPGTAEVMVKAAHSDEVTERGSKQKIRIGADDSLRRTSYRGMEVDDSDSWTNGIYQVAGVPTEKRPAAPITTQPVRDTKNYMADQSSVTYFPTSMVTHTADPNVLFEGVPVGIEGISNVTRPLGSPRATQPTSPSASQPLGVNLPFAAGARLHQPLNQMVATSHFGQLRNFNAKGEKIANLRHHLGTDLRAALGTPVFSIADGEVVRAGPSVDENGRQGPAGYRIWINHGSKTEGGSSSRYLHLSADGILVRPGQKVRGGQQIALSGDTSNRKVPPHLHFEMRGKNGRPLDPEDYFVMTSAEGPRTRGAIHGPGTGASGHISVLERSIQEYEKTLQNGQALRMVRAFPTFKLYFIEDDSEDRKRFGLDDFFSYNAVKSIRVIRSRKIAADLMVVELTNVSGNLTNRKFRYEDPSAAQNTDTLKENPLQGIAIQEGIDVELKLGYASDPEKLSTVFVGKIMETEFNETEDLITITCQSHAIELVQDTIGLEKPDIRDGWFISDARTNVLLENMMARPEMLHFGRWTRSGETNTNTQAFRHVLQNKFRLSPTPQDDNIFAPDSRRLDGGWVFDNLEYAIYQRTIWDIFQEMTLRHPGCIASPVPYRDRFGPRMTMFFGLPSQLYFARDPTLLELQKQHNIAEEVRQDATESVLEALQDPTTDIYRLARAPVVRNAGSAQAETIRAQIGSPSSMLELAKKIQEVARRNPVVHAAMVQAQRRMINAQEESLARESSIIRPFRNYHVLTSSHHIIHNNIAASSKDSYNTVTMQYGEVEFDKDTGKFQSEATLPGFLQWLPFADEDLKTFTLKVDAGLPDEEIRELFVSDYINCSTELLARRYAQALLAHSLKDIYKGEIVIIGNPDIRPYDICMVFDEYSDMSGPIEVEQVTHLIGQETGFITEIVPDLFTTTNEWTNMTLADAMGVFIEGSLKSLYQNTATGAGDLAVTGLKGAGLAGIAGLAFGGPLAFAVAGAAVFGAGLFMRKKVLDFTDHAQPVIMHPLMHNGRPVLAGLPMRKLDNTWSTRLGQWIKDGAEGWDILLEDFYDKLTLAPTEGKLSNLFSGTDIPPKF